MTLNNIDASDRYFRLLTK